MPRLLLLFVLTAGCTACTATYQLAKNSGHSPDYQFRKAVHVDLQCVAAPWFLMTENSLSTPNDAMMALYLSAGVSAYGLLDLPFSYSAYGLYQAHDFARDTYADFQDRWR